MINVETSVDQLPVMYIFHTGETKLLLLYILHVDKNTF